METALSRSSPSSALSPTSQSPSSSSSSSLVFNDFLHKMRNPASVNLVRSIKSFIVSFTFSAGNPEEDGKKVQEFYSTMEAAISEHPLWASATSEEIDCAMEGLEKYLMTKLFSRTFAASPEDGKVDQELSEKMQLLQTFLRPEHLDIPLVLQNEASWLLAEKEMLKINACKAPREKLLCILSCCKVINNLLLNASMSENHVLGGADDFLPVLIYVTIKANPPQLHSNLKFIQLYRRQAKLVSAAAYHLTNLVSAKAFIADLTAKSFSIDEIDFEEGMQSARLANNTSQAEQLSKMGEVKASRPEMVPDALTGIGSKGINLDMLDRSKYPYMEAKPGDMTAEDVEILLSLYKEVVTKYTSLYRTVQQILTKIGSSPHSEGSSAFLAQPEISMTNERYINRKKREQALKQWMDHEQETSDPEALKKNCSAFNPYF